MERIIPEWPAPEKVKAFSTVRYGGFSPAPYHGSPSGIDGLNFGLHVGDNPVLVQKNRALLKSFLPSEPVWLNQVHSNHVVDAASVRGCPDADAAYTTKENCVCVVMTADCLPVLLCTADGGAVAAVHAGWRGLVAGIFEKTIDAIRRKRNSAILAWLGPAIGPMAFEVGEDVRQAYRQKNAAMDAAFKPHGKEGKYLADIFCLARLTLKAVDVDKIYGGGICTVSDPAHFYSYRRDGVTGRMATGIWIAA